MTVNIINLLYFVVILAYWWLTYRLMDTVLDTFGVEPIDSSVMSVLFGWIAAPFIILFITVITIVNLVKKKDDDNE